jgi:hypothetical protein
MLGLLRLLYNVLFGVADPGCLSQILIFIHPGSPATKIVIPPFVIAKYHKNDNYFIFEQVKNKI